MIPCKATDADLARYVANIVTQVRSASPGQCERGRQWYPVAHDIAEDIGRGDVRLGAGVLAALSPMRSWGVTQRIARESVETGQASRSLG